jgi:hypothetical protein
MKLKVSYMINQPEHSNRLIERNLYYTNYIIVFNRNKIKKWNFISKMNEFIEEDEVIISTRIGKAYS